MTNQLSNIKRYINTAERHISKANREYAYYKNCDKQTSNYLNPEDKQKHYMNAQNNYKKAKDLIDKAKSLIDGERITDSEILNRWKEARNKIKDFN